MLGNIWFERVNVIFSFRDESQMRRANFPDVLVPGNLARPESLAIRSAFGG